MMERNVNSTCDLHPDRFDCPDALIDKGGDNYGIIIHDGGCSVIRINYCPWCAADLSKHKPVEKPE
jgi:hypothetical protein